MLEIAVGAALAIVLGCLGWWLFQRSVQRSLREAEVEMRRMERVRRDFVTNVSHELRTPVAVIRANAETLLDGALDDPPAARRFVGAIARHAESLSRMLDDLLDLARIEAEGYKLELHPVDLQALARRCTEGMEQRARRSGISLSCRIDEALHVRADERALDQVLLNLVENAVRYNEQGGSVVLRAQRMNGRVRLEVQDDGVGLSEKEQGRIFERFYRVDRGRSRESGGTGLGLSIVKHLVEAMGGSLGVDSALGRGSTFFVDLDAA